MTALSTVIAPGTRQNSPRHSDSHNIYNTLLNKVFKGDQTAVYGGTAQYESFWDSVPALKPPPILAQFLEGSAASPNTNAVGASVFVSRRSAVNGSGDTNAALWASHINNGTQQPVAIQGSAENIGAGDACAFYARVKAATGSSYAYFGLASVPVGGTHANVFNPVISNDSGVDANYNNSGTAGSPQVFAILIQAITDAAHTSGTGIAFAASVANFDVGIYAGAVIKSYLLLDESNAITSIKINGTHTTGIDMSGAAISGAALKAKSSGGVTITHDTVSAGQAALETFIDGGTAKFQIGKDSANNFIIYDSVRTEAPIVIAAADGALTVCASGKTLGFYGHAATALQTGVAVNAAGIHAALVALGLITA